MYTCEKRSGLSIFSIACVRLNVEAPQTVAVLIRRKELKVCDYDASVWEMGNREKKVSVKLNDTRHVCSWRSVIELHSRELVAKVVEMRNLHVWNMEEQNARPLSIPCGYYMTCAMSVLKNVLGREELLELSFCYDNSIGIFAIEQSKIVLVRSI